MAKNNDNNQLYQNRDVSSNELRADPDWEKRIYSHLDYYGKIIANLGGINAVARTDEFMTDDELEGRLKSVVTGKLLGAFGMSRGIFGRRQSELMDKEDITALLIEHGFFNEKDEAEETADKMVDLGIGNRLNTHNEYSDYFFQEYTNTLGRKKYKLVKRQNHYGWQ